MEDGHHATRERARDDRSDRGGRWHPMILFFAFAGGVGCQQMKRSETSTQDGFAKVTFQVTGMMKARSGAT